MDKMRGLGTGERSVLEAIAKWRALPSWLVADVAEVSATQASRLVEQLVQKKLVRKEPYLAPLPGGRGSLRKAGNALQLTAAGRRLLGVKDSSAVRRRDVGRWLSVAAIGERWALAGLAVTPGPAVKAELGLHKRTTPAFGVRTGDDRWWLIHLVETCGDQWRRRWEETQFGVFATRLAGHVFLAESEATVQALREHLRARAKVYALYVYLRGEWEKTPPPCIAEGRWAGLARVLEELREEWPDTVVVDRDPVPERLFWRIQVAGHDALLTELRTGDQSVFGDLRTWHVAVQRELGAAERLIIAVNDYDQAKEAAAAVPALVDAEAMFVWCQRQLTRLSVFRRNAEEEVERRRRKPGPRPGVKRRIIAKV